MSKIYEARDYFGYCYKAEVIGVTNSVLLLLLGGDNEATICNASGNDPTYSCKKVDWETHKINRADLPEEPAAMVLEGTEVGKCKLTGKRCLYLAEYNQEEAELASKRQT